MCVRVSVCVCVKNEVWMGNGGTLGGMMELLKISLERWDVVQERVCGVCVRECEVVHE